MRLRSAVVALLVAGALTAFLPDAAGAAGPGKAVHPSASSPGPAASGTADSGSQWPLALLDATALWQRTRGAGITIAVVDTGIDPGVPDLKGVRVESHDLLGGHPPVVSATSHGTEVAECIAGGGGLAGPGGLAPAASLIDIRVATSLSTVTAAGIAAGIKAAVQSGAQIINISVGVPQDTPTLQATVVAAEQQGRLLIASAGTRGLALYPAAIDGVLSVGAEDQHRNRASAPAQTVLFAPGTGLFASGDHETGLGVLNGSDFGAAYVSAAAALVLSTGSTLKPSAVGGNLTAAAGPSKLLNPGQAIELAAAPTPAPTQPPTHPASSQPKPTLTARPTAQGTPALVYLVAAIVVVIVVFAAFLVFIARWTRRPATGVARPSASVPPHQQRANDRVPLPLATIHEPFSWDHTW